MEKYTFAKLSCFGKVGGEGEGEGGGGSCEDAYIESLIETVISINIDWKDGLHYHHGAQRLWLT